MKKNILEEITKILATDEKIVVGEKRKGRDRVAAGEERKNKMEEAHLMLNISNEKGGKKP
jgi:hypothetical protein